MEQNAGHKLEKIITNLSGLPSMPFIVNKISEVVGDKQSSAKDIADVIAIDQSLAAKLLKLVNSSFFGFSSKITTISRAIVVLGFETVKTLALGVSVFKTASTLQDGESTFFDMEKFWEHSIGVAAGAKLLAALTGHKQLEEAFLAGLLHDIGKVIFVQYMPDEFAKTLYKSQEEKIPLLLAEQQILKVDHEVAGDYLSLRWKIPFQLRKVISSHHNPPFKKKDLDPKVLKLIAIVSVSNTLCKLNKIGFSGNSIITAKDEEIMNWLGIDESEINRFFLQIDSEIKTAKEFLGIITASEDATDSDTKNDNNTDSVLLLYKNHKDILLSSLFLKKINMNFHEVIYDTNKQPWLSIENLKIILTSGLDKSEIDNITTHLNEVGQKVDISELPQPFNQKNLLTIIDIQSDPLLEDQLIPLLQDINTRKILLIDDKPDEINFIAQELENNDFKTEILSTPEHTIKKVQDLKPSLIIINLDLQESSALTLIKMLSGFLSSMKEFKHIKIIVISSYLTEHIIEEIRKLKISSLLKKPFETSLLIEKINRLISG